MAEIKTREKSKGIKALDKAVVAGERMKRAFVRSKDQAENLLDDGQISPSEYAEDKVRYMAEDTAREVGHEAGKLTGKAKSACRSHREAKRTADAAQQDRTRIRHARSQTIKTAEARQRTVKQTAKSTGQATVKTAKGTVKTAQKSAKTAQQTSKAAIKTAEATAKATKAAAQTSAKAARTTAQAAKTAAQTLVAAAKAAAKAIASAAKAIAAAVKALVAAIAAGGWVALIVIVIICLIAAVVACFGIFFSSEDTGSDKPMRTVVQEINQEYQAQLDDIKGSVVYDTLEMSGSRAVWPEVLSVYAVKVTSDPDNPQEVATVTPEKEQILRDIFWAMNTISHSTTTESVTTIIESDDGHGNILEETVTETKTTLHIVVSHKTATEMAAEYGFGERQLEHLDRRAERIPFSSHKRNARRAECLRLRYAVYSDAASDGLHKQCCGDGNQRRRGAQRHDYPQCREEARQHLGNHGRHRYHGHGGVRQHRPYCKRDRERRYHGCGDCGVYKSDPHFDGRRRGGIQRRRIPAGIPAEQLWQPVPASIDIHYRIHPGPFRGQGTI